ncbi:XRN 5'-3' exonuclease N-terminus [Carpediemonas membranifera]|uniref:XRN 5'-3' exonuclease N-terminus n=1 Tax=Carpediemonas membranifera TaxID=201153 RepID=A0A8J6E192_9EUKA|nr:XRN 5'-3' exonuclease N-terminus [Carpediemonas membranifera]|eukprot:KAG9396054.1 XRN 5'-3' exonuclease N-terminus [Carpediemonas membranifera]
MGVPAFFKWLLDRYPACVEDAVEDQHIMAPGATSWTRPFDSDPRIWDQQKNLPERNGRPEHYDALYLDMNGLIHPCFHPENEFKELAPKTDAEVFQEVFLYVDRLFGIVKPRKLVYMAVDGPAPRAKMNQQRARRFVAAQESQQNKRMKLKVQEACTARGIDLPEEWSKKSSRDSNVITPGTEFLCNLSQALEIYIRYKLSTSEQWRGVTVILSDASVPGEGEHKIFEHIRRQRSQTDSPAVQRHCIYGMDADLIFLSLASHEPNFSIIREVVFDRGRHKCGRCGRMGHTDGSCDFNPPSSGAKQRLCFTQAFQFMHVWVFRQYLEKEFGKLLDNGDRPGFDFERILDDFVLLCFMSGNDFLPHIPGLDIRSGAVGTLVNLYSAYLQDAIGTDPYITANGQIRFDKMAGMLKGLTLVEEEHVKKIVTGYKQGRGFEAKQAGQDPKVRKLKELGITPEGEKQANKALYDALAGKTRNLGAEIELQPNGEPVYPCTVDVDAPDDLYANHYVDEPVRYGTKDWQVRYYQAKFGWNTRSPEFESYRDNLLREYARGLQWVFSYYHRRVASWEWFFPYHYAPLMSDLDLITERKLWCNEDGTNALLFPEEAGDSENAPLPFEQLLSVLPPYTARNTLPGQYYGAMVDATGVLRQFYPNNFTLDRNGARFEWQALALLPFIEREALKAKEAQLRATLTPEEAARNVRGIPIVLMRQTALDIPAEWGPLDPDRPPSLHGYMRRLTVPREFIDTSSGEMMANYIYPMALDDAYAIFPGTLHREVGGGRVQPYFVDSTVAFEYKPIEFGPKPISELRRCYRNSRGANMLQLAANKLSKPVDRWGNVRAPDPAPFDLLKRTQAPLSAMTGRAKSIAIQKLAPPSTSMTIGLKGPVSLKRKLRERQRSGGHVTSDSFTVTKRAKE